MMDGWSLWVLGRTRIGKSSLLVDLVEGGPFVWTGPEPMNPDVVAFQERFGWCYDSTADLKANAARIRDLKGTFSIRLKYYNPLIFEVLNVKYKTIVFDEGSGLARNKATKEPFVMFLRVAPSRDQHIFGSTHRATKDLPPEVLHSLTKYIFQCGPQRHPDEVEELYHLCDADTVMDLDEFREKLKNLEKYDYERRNFNSAVLVIAGGNDAPRPERRVSKGPVDQAGV
jgi:hypothetical protein